MGIIFASCSSTAPLIYQPKSGNIEYTNGKKISVLSNIDLQLKVSMDNFQMGRMVFDVEIFNTSNFEIDVDPINFFLSPTNAKGLADTTISKLYALNPEKEIANLNYQISKVELNQSIASAAGCCLDFANFGASTVAIAKNKTPQNNENQQQTIDNNSRNAQDNQETEILRLRDEIAYWQNNAIRRTTLHPHQLIIGKVVFEIKDKLPFYEVFFKLGTSIFSVVFEKQVQYSAPSSNSNGSNQDVQTY